LDIQKISLPLNYEQENFCHSLRNTLHEYFIEYWKDQIQQGRDNMVNWLIDFKQMKITFSLQIVVIVDSQFPKSAGHCEKVKNISSIDCRWFSSLQCFIYQCLNIVMTEWGRYVLLKPTYTKLTNPAVNFINNLRIICKTKGL
jgi:hypothetical protein